MAKRLALLTVMALLAAALLAGCGGTEDPATTSTTQGTSSLSESSSFTETTEPESSSEDSTATDDPNSGETGKGTTGSTAPPAVAAKPATPVADDRTQSAQVIGYVKDVQDILNSGRLTLKGNVTVGDTAFPLTLVSDGDKAAAELPTAMLSNLYTDSQLGGLASLESVFGKTSRLVILPGRMLLVLPDLRSYFDMGDMQDEELTADMLFEMTEPFGDSELLENIKTSTAQIGGKTHQVAAVSDADGETIARLYFLEGQLKRLELTGEDEDVVIDVTSLSGTADASYLSTDGLIPIDLAALQSMGGRSLPGLR